MISDSDIGNIIESTIVNHGHVWEWDETVLREFAAKLLKEERLAIVDWLDEQADTAREFGNERAAQGLEDAANQLREGING